MIRIAAILICIAASGMLLFIPAFVLTFAHLLPGEIIVIGPLGYVFLAVSGVLGLALLWAAWKIFRTPQRGKLD